MLAVLGTRSRRATRRAASEDLERWLVALAREISRFDGSARAAAAIYHTAAGAADAARTAHELGVDANRRLLGGSPPSRITRARDRRARGFANTIAAVLACGTLHELAVNCEHLAFVADDLSNVAGPWQP